MNRWSPIIATVVGSLLASTASAAPPSQADLAARVREIHKMVVAVQALAESPLDEKGRRSLTKRLARIDEELSELELALREAPAVSPAAAPAAAPAAPVVVPAPPRPVAPPAAPAPTARPMSPAELSRLMTRLEDAAFTSDRAGALEDALHDRTVTGGQAARVLGAFSFSSERVDAARVLLGSLADLADAGALVEAMQFSGEKDEVREMIRQARAAK